jgi:phosphate transport system substrate-binding protein
MSAKFIFNHSTALLMASTLAFGLVSCGETQTNTSTNSTTPPAENTSNTSGVTGDVLIDGSSTVFPISEAMAEEFMKANQGTKVTVGVSGTGGGFKKFCAGETDIANASRPIKESEMELCKAKGIEYIEVAVAFDGLSVVTNKENNWVTCLKPDDLKTMWQVEAEGKIMKWNQVRPDFPDQALSLFGPGTDSGTYDYFTDAINDKEGESRGDFTASEDDNVIVQGVESDKGSLGFFGFAYYEENKDQLKIVEIENSEGKCVIPTHETIADASYNPLSRPLFFYVNKKALEEKPQVKAFTEYNLDNANKHFIDEVGYVSLPDDIRAKVQTRVDNKTVGSIFGGKSSVGVKLSEALK